MRGSRITIDLNFIDAEPWLTPAYHYQGKTFTGPSHVGAKQAAAVHHQLPSHNQVQGGRLGYQNEHGQFMSTAGAHAHAEKHGLFHPAAPSWVHGLDELPSDVWNKYNHKVPTAQVKETRRVTGDARSSK